MKKLLTLGMATLAVAGIAGMNGQGNGMDDPSTVRKSHGKGNGRQASLESRAQIVDMTADELQTALETKTMSQIAVEKGMTEETFRAKMTEAAQARWEARGLSSEEIAKRIADREARHAANSATHEFGSGEGSRLGGYGQNR